MKIYQKINLAYVAGLIDGEGCFSTSDNGRGYLGLRLTVVNTNKDVLIWAKTEFGGVVFEKQRGKIHWKKCYSWLLSQKDLRVILPELIPFLRIKKLQGEAALRFLTSKYGNKEAKKLERITIQGLNK